MIETLTKAKQLATRAGRGALRDLEALLRQLIDVGSNSLATLSVTTTITRDQHLGKTLVMSGAGAARTFTLPPATGSGDRYLFVVGAVNTSNYVIKVADATDTIDGGVFVNGDNASNAVTGFTPAASDDTITLNGTTTGGQQIGDWVELIDIAANQWMVRGMLTESGAEATPFSATVS